MKVGCVRERKKLEYRVGMTPENAHAYVAHGHEVWVENGAGAGAGFNDDDYAKAGAKMALAKDIWANCEMIVKVKEPLSEEYPLMRDGQIVYAYLHLAADKTLTQALVERGVKGVAYETIKDKAGGLPCLKPMSEIAGRISVIEGAHYLKKTHGGMGLLVCGIPGVPKAKVVILGGGIVGTNACKMAMGLGADVTIFDVSLDRLTYLDDIFGSRIQTMYSTDAAIAAACAQADLVVGAVLIPGGATPKLIKREYLPHMKTSCVIVDVAVDQGGCCETSHVTYHDEPTYVVDGVIHYCVANIPGAVPRSSTIGLTNATLHYGLSIADMGLEKACEKIPGIIPGINTYAGKLTCEGVGAALDMPCTDVTTLMK